MCMEITPENLLMRIVWAERFLDQTWEFGYYLFNTGLKGTSDIRSSVILAEIKDNVD